MADTEIVHRRSLMWLWWVVGVVLVGAVLWFGASSVGGKAADLETNPEAPPPTPQPQTLQEAPRPAPGVPALKLEAPPSSRSLAA